MDNDYLTALVAALGPVQLTAEEQRLVEWLARWDRPTVSAAASLFTKLRGVKP